MKESRMTRAAELAEWLVDEISSAEGDWRAIAQRAGELARLAARGAERPTSNGAPGGVRGR
ncbi:MAG TPA: hypothetical protein VMG62_06870 [Solirubrobacteraceae bacterium]|nr:hypothetical protein [Solirubrobacteraceae bacterium]